jgi:hypothetical protein
VHRRRVVRFVSGTLVLVSGVAFMYARDAPMRAGVAFQHLAAVRELARGEFPPRHNLIAGHAPQGHYGPYFVALGFLARMSGASPKATLYGAGVAGALVLSLLAGWVTRLLAGDEAASWAPWCAAFLWGPWPAPVMSWAAWGWPGTTSPAEAQNFFYPQHAGLLLLLAVVGVLIAPVRESYRWLAAWLLSAALMATHPLTGLALAVATASLAAGEIVHARVALSTAGAGPTVRARFFTARAAALLLLPGVALAAAALWPYYPVLGLLGAFGHPGVRASTAALGGVPSVGVRHALIPPVTTPLLSILGPAVVGLVGVAWLSRRREWRPLIWAVLSILVVYCPGLPLRQRLAMFVAVPLHIGACALLAHDRRWIRRLVVVLLAAGALSAVLRSRWVLAQEALDLSFLPPLVPEDAVVLTDPRTSNAVAGLTGRKIVAPEGPDVLLILAGGWQRSLDVERYLGLGTSADERRAILDRWQVTHVLIDRMGYGGPVDLPYPRVYEGGGFELYDVRR